MFADLTDAEFRELHTAYKAALIAGTRIIRHKFGDSEVEKSLTIDLADPVQRSAISAEYIQRFGANRPVRSRTIASFA